MGNDFTLRALLHRRGGSASGDVSGAPKGTAGAFSRVPGAFPSPRYRYSADVIHFDWRSYEQLNWWEPLWGGKHYFSYCLDGAGLEGSTSSYCPAHRALAVV